MMNIDPNGHWVRAAVGAGFSAYDAYKTYKKTRSWKKAGWAAAKSIGSSLLMGGAFKVAGRAAKVAYKGYQAQKNVRRASKVMRLAKRITYTNTVASHMANSSRYIPKYYVANTIKYGKKAADTGVRGFKKLSNRTAYSSMYKNGRKYQVKVVYNKFTKRVYHAHYYK